MHFLKVLKFIIKKRYITLLNKLGYDMDYLKRIIKKDIVRVTVTYINYEGVTCRGNIYVHELISDKVSSIFKDMYVQRFPIRSIYNSDGVDDSFLIKNNFTSAFNFRYVNNTKRLSNHAFGMAVDINPKANPATPSSFKDLYDTTITMGVIDDSIIDLFKRHGFLWGGEIFGNFIDRHHFEYRIKYQ